MTCTYHAAIQKSTLLNAWAHKAASDSNVFLMCACYWQLDIKNVGGDEVVCSALIFRDSSTLRCFRSLVPQLLYVEPSKSEFKQSSFPFEYCDIAEFIIGV